MNTAASTLAALNAELALAGSNLYVFEDAYNEHRLTISGLRGCTSYTLARTQLRTAAQVARYIRENEASLRAAAARWGAHLTRAEDVAAEEARFEARLAAAA